MKELSGIKYGMSLRTYHHHFVAFNPSLNVHLGAMQILICVLFYQFVSLYINQTLPIKKIVKINIITCVNNSAWRGKEVNLLYRCM